MKRGFLIGCGALLLITFAAICVAIFSAPKFVRDGISWAQAQMAVTSRLNTIANDWTPPETPIGETWFPAQIEDWSQSGFASPVSLPEVQSRPLTGASARYAQTNGRTVKVTVVPVADGEKTAVLKETEDAFLREPSSLAGNTSTARSHVTTRVHDRVHLVVNGDTHMRLWWIKGYLFIFQSTGTDDPVDFATSYLNAISSAK